MIFLGKPLIHSRGYATLKDIQMRLKAIKNIGKITKSMKMIASTKLNRAQKSMEVGRVFGQCTQNVLGHLQFPGVEGKKDYLPATELNVNITKSDGGEGNKKALILACSSDRGLCGAIHSSVSKYARRLAAQDRENTSIVVLGDKAKPQISRDSRQNIVMHFTQVGRNIPIFLDALVIAQDVKANKDLKYENLAIIYNRFISVINYEPVLVKMPTVKGILGCERLRQYEYEDDVVANLADYLLASRLYWALVEGHAAEMSSKRTAMENATKNSEEICLALTMKYNRTRQAVITNELVDIITGAAAL